MGIDYYLKIDDLCPHCGHVTGTDEMHIGKSSAGWTFALHVYPEMRITDLEDWKPLLEGNEIIDEYGNTIAYTEMLRIITDRSGAPGSSLRPACAVEGPNGLWRSRIDGIHCIGHGEGTWDLHVGDPS